VSGMPPMRGFGAAPVAGLGDGRGANISIVT
jgi:hypothetical protein